MASMVRLLTLTAAIALGVSAPAAAGVAYLKDKQVWLASLDGVRKMPLSTGDPWWNAVGQSDTGGVVATKNEPGKIFQLSQFAIWNPDGSLKDQGPASPGTSFSGGSLAMPLGLELTADNQGVIYGYSYLSGFYPSQTLQQGYAILPSATRTTPTSVYTNSDVRWPTLAGGRVIGSPDGSSQIAGETSVGNLTGPFTNFNIAISVPDGRIHAVHGSDAGTLLAAEIGIEPPPPAPSEGKILMIKTTGMVGEYADDCWLPTGANATDADVSADGSLVAWSDDEGVKVAGAPVFPAGATCTLSSPPVLIDPGGKDPALGPIDVEALYAARNPVTPGQTTTPPTTTSPTITTSPPTSSPSTSTLAVPAPGASPAVALGPGPRAAALASGMSIGVAVGKAGVVTVRVTVAARSVGRRGKAIVIATGKATASGAGRLTVKLKPTKAGKALRKRLRGKRATFTVTGGGQRTVKTVKLR